MSVRCNWDQDISSCVTFNTDKRPTAERILSKAGHTEPLTLSLTGHCTECTVVSSCRTVECYLSQGYHSSVRGEILEKRDSCTVYRAVVRPDSVAVCLKLLSNTSLDKSVVHLVQCHIVLGEAELDVQDTTSRINIQDTMSRINIPAVQDMLPEECREKSEGVFKMMQNGGGMGSLMASLGGLNIANMQTQLPAPLNTKGCSCNCEASLKKVLAQQTSLQTQISTLRQDILSLQKSMEGSMSVILQAVKQSELSGYSVKYSDTSGCNTSEARGNGGVNSHRCGAAADVIKGGYQPITEQDSHHMTCINQSQRSEGSTDLSDVNLDVKCHVKCGQVSNGCLNVGMLVDCDGQTLD